MASAVKGPGSLRLRLLAAFALVSIPPLLLLAAAVLFLVDQAFDTAIKRRLEQGLASAERRIESLERRASREVAAIADDLLDEPQPIDEKTAARLAEAHELAALEFLDAEGRALSSAHWPAGFGLPDRDQTFAGAPALRIETAAEGYGAGERLTLTASQRTSYGGKTLTVRGGYFLDEAFWSEMQALLGLEVGLRDRERGSFVTSPASPLVSWVPEGATGVGALPGGVTHRWLSAPVGRALTLFVAAPTGDWEALSSRVRLASLAVAGGSLLAAIGLAMAMTRGIAGPASALAKAAGRVAEGDLTAQVPVSGDDELANLARAFNQMTANLRATQDRLLQAERVAAWREIARRLAHELKNPIFPIALSMQTLERATNGVTLPTVSGTDLQTLLRDSIRTALDELGRLQRVVDEFSAFARLPHARPQPTNLEEVVGHVLALYQPRLPHVTVRSDIEPGLPLVPADADLLVRALGNLVTNALEAMPEGGTLTVRVHRRSDGVAIEVEDTGSGLTEEQKARLFTPYFTTKAGGTGLGLAIVQGIASDHGGRVEVRPASPHGMVFSLVLPARLS